MLCIDVDHFQRINSALGHAAGDVVLEQLAGRISKVIAETAFASHCCATLGKLDGDEFLVAVETFSPGHSAMRVARLISDQLAIEVAAPFILPSGPVHITVSTGLADEVQREPASSADDLLRDAGTALREAKAAGRARAIAFERKMRVSASRTHQLEHALRGALTTGQGIATAYQPIVDLTTRLPAAVEVLTRWSHPEIGTVSPSEFIPIAEEHGLIDELWARVLPRACRDFSLWRARYGDAAPSSLSINLSRAQALNANLPLQIAKALSSFNLPAAALQVEITESMAGHEQHVRHMLLALRGIGVQVALDDFGTGYSSLAFLQSMPATAIKLDRSFIHGAEADDLRQGMIAAIVKMAALYNLKVVAEGVETEEQHSMVERMGCDLGQGFLYSRPVPAHEMSSWIEASLAQDISARAPQAVARQA